MPAVNVVQPVYFAVVSQDTLGDTYEAVCESIGLNSIAEGFGLMLAIREDLTRVTMIAKSAQLVRDIADASPDARNFMIIGDGQFPIAGPDWVAVPDAAVIGRAGKLAVLGPPDDQLGPQYVVHSITYYDDGVEIGRGFAQAPELDAWRTDLTRDGWVVDDRAAVEQLSYRRIEEIVIRGAELATTLQKLDALPADYRLIAAALIDATDALCTLADAGERPDSPASRAVVGALLDALNDHDAYPADRRPA